jgi:hypothetical protein
MAVMSERERKRRDKEKGAGGREGLGECIWDRMEEVYICSIVNLYMNRRGGGGGGIFTW